MIGSVHIAAFQSDAEADLVAALRGTEDWIPELSLVAQQDEMIVGHALMSRVTAGDSDALALGPVAIVPKYQGKGFGRGLVATALARAAELDFDCAIVIGPGWFFSRFGFRPARTRGLELAIPVPDPAFLVAEFKVGGVTRGPVLWPDAWDMG